MDNYILTVVCAASFGIVADIVNGAVSKRLKGLEKYIRFGITVCIASCMILPILNGQAEELVTVYNTSGTDERAILDNTDDSLYILERECEEKISEKIFSESGIKPINVSIKIKTENGVPRVKSAEIVIEEKDRESIPHIRETAASALGTNADILTEA